MLRPPVLIIENLFLKNHVFFPAVLVDDLKYYNTHEPQPVRVYSKCFVDAVMNKTQDHS